MTVAEIQRIGTPDISKATARSAFLAYKRGILSETDAVRRREYEALMRGYRAISQGKQVLDLHQAMRSAGLQEDVKRLPKLAICRADAAKCTVRVNEKMVRHRFVTPPHRGVLARGTFPYPLTRSRASVAVGSKTFRHGLARRSCRSSRHRFDRRATSATTTSSGTLCG